LDARGFELTPQYHLLLKPCVHDLSGVSQTTQLTETMRLDLSRSPGNGFVFPHD
jgi:hypothetical protein